tara:strand:- start:448 stop:1119 length:672 start_codon:yes stop_codon:yes gene_type:complete
MDLAALKNLDVKDLLSKIKGADLLNNKKLLIKFGIGFGSIIIFLVIYYAFVSPIVKSQNEKILLMNENKTKIEEFKSNIVTLSKTIKKREPEFKKNSKLFHSKKEVEDLYQNISNFALRNGLSIINLKKGEPKAVNNNNSAQNDNNTQNSENSENQQALYYKIPVNYEIKGNFLGYLKFRRALASSAKVINFDKEEINVLKEVQGQVLSKGTISIVGLPNEYK